MDGTAMVVATRAPASNGEKPLGGHQFNTGDHEHHDGSGQHSPGEDPVAEDLGIQQRLFQQAVPEGEQQQPNNTEDGRDNQEPDCAIGIGQSFDSGDHTEHG